MKVVQNTVESVFAVGVTGVVMLKGLNGLRCGSAAAVRSLVATWMPLGREVVVEFGAEPEGLSSECWGLGVRRMLERRGDRDRVLGV